MIEDKLLIWKFKRGSRDALCRIYSKYGDYLLAVSAALLKDIHTAEDVVHDVFCRFIDNREKVKLAGSLKSFLGTCAVNLCRDRLRARKSNPGELDESAAAERISNMNGPEDNAIFGEEAVKLHRAIGELSYEQQEAIMLHVRGDMKFREIAGVQGVSINTAKSRYRYGLDKLRKLLSDQES